MRVYFDIETKGLYGEIREFAYVAGEGNTFKTYQWDGEFKTLKKFVEEMLSKGKEFFCWHYYQVAVFVEYFGADLFEEMCKTSEITILVSSLNLEKFIDTKVFKSVRIKEVTEEILNREHKGNAMQDALDLKCIIERLEGK